MKVYCLLFNGYETLDLMGPIEFLHRMPELKLTYVSMSGGLIQSTQGFSVDTEKLLTLSEESILLVPGGQGTRKLVEDKAFINQLKIWAEQSKFCLTVCTGSALLAATGLLNGLKATSNKRAFEWAKSVNPQVNWQAIARWVQDGKFYTSSGVSAGMDMALGFIQDQFGNEQAELVANQTEYSWHYDPSNDQFAALYGYIKFKPN